MPILVITFFCEYKDRNQAADSMVVTSMGYSVVFYRTKNNIKESNGFILALPKMAEKQNNKAMKNNSVEIMERTLLNNNL